MRCIDHTSKTPAQTETACFASFHTGTFTGGWAHFGAHLRGESVQFCVWAPEAARVDVIGSFNNWQPCPLSPCADDPSVWSGTLDGVQAYDAYKYRITAADGSVADKADPYAFYAELRPGNASRVFDLAGYEWHDLDWRQRVQQQAKPLNIYEVHLGSWRTHPDGSFYTYREFADCLIPYAVSMGYTALQLLPVTEYPFDGSWGYQPLGWFAATSRYGTPHDLMYFVDRCHQAGLAVLLDWMAAGFARDAHGLVEFDGSCCYEYADSGRAEMPLLGTIAFDLGKPEVRSFLLSSADFWLTCCHFDGLRVNATQSMLFRDYGHTDGNWIPNELGGNVNLEGVEFLRTLNERMHANNPHAMLAAGEAARWPQITRSVDVGGLGFDLVWNDNWVEELLASMPKSVSEEDFLLWMMFSLMDSFNENYVLPLCHDAVAHGEGSLLARIPGTYPEKFAGLRALYGFVFAHPGHKLLFMGEEFAQLNEWVFHHELDWHLLDSEAHRQMLECVRGLNLFYQHAPELWNSSDCVAFSWLDRGEMDRGVLAFARSDAQGHELYAVLNIGDTRYTDYRIRVPESGVYQEVFTTDLRSYGGSGVRNADQTASELPDGAPGYSLSITSAPKSVLFLRRKPNIC